MRVSSVLTLTGLLIVSYAAVTVQGRSRRRMKKCVYIRKGERGECNPVTGHMEVTYRLKSARMRYDCLPAKVKLRRCPGCKYPGKKSIPFTNCVNGRMFKEVPLGSGSMAGCPPKRIISRRCRRGKGISIKGMRGCVYMNKEWSECNEETNTRQREKVLVSGDSRKCLPKKMVTKKCRKACRYIKGTWSECDNVTSTKNRTMDPKPGSLPQCVSKIQTRFCFLGADSKRGKATKCRYRSGEWSQCDPRTNTRTQEMTLRNGDPNLCKRSVKLTRKCKLACKFRRGEWSECDKMTRLMTRVDLLDKGDPKECDNQREITRKCRKSKCKYSLSDWSECNSETNSRTRMKVLMATDKSKNCKETMTISKSCIGKDGEARCFFGSWGEFGPCTNGVKTKQRPLIQGGVECERKAVAAIACDE